MRHVVLAVLIVSLAVMAFGQSRPGPYYSLGGFGSVLYPGTGHAPPTPPGGITGPNFAQRFGASVAGRGILPNPVQANHPQHGRTVIVPYPVYYGGYSGYYDQPPAYPEQPPMAAPNTAPAVVINQTFVPPTASPVVREYAPSDTGDQQSGLRLYQAPPTHPYSDAADNPAPARRAAASDQPTIYLIAFKDHSIVQALGYWMEGSALHYVSVEHTLNQASLDLIDRDLSQRLNDERGLEFKLPPAK